MGIMGYLRNHAGIVVFLIGLAIIAFLLGDVINYGTPFWAKGQNEVGSVNGNSIDYQEFNAQVDQTAAMYQNQMGGGANPQMRSFAVQQVWNQFISQELLKQEIEKIGLTVAKEELNNLVHGNEPSLQIVQAFSNPETGQFDRNFLNQFLDQIGTGNIDPQMAQQWEVLLGNVRNEKLNEKYSNLLNNSIYVTSLEAKEGYEERNKLANFKYLFLDYASVKDSEIKPSDADFKEYYDANKNKFNTQEETRSLEYVVINAQPTSADTAATLSTIEQLKSELINSKDDSLFVNIHADSKRPVTYYNKGQLGTGLDTLLFDAAVGTIVGPILSNGAYEIAKIVDTKFSADSVQASHILLNTTAEGGIDKANAKADSIKALIQSGESFAGLAIQFSIDEGSKVNGGELGTFARGQMIPEFENAVFDGKPGEVVIVNSQFGTHIVKIEKHIGYSKIVKTAIVDKAIVSSKATTDAAYTKANQFFSAVNGDNFTDEANKQGLNPERVSKTPAMTAYFNATEVPRELVRWAFGAKVGEVSDKIYEADDNFIIARVTAIQPKGAQSLNAVKQEIEPMVKNAVKAKMLKEKLNNALAGATSLDQAAGKVEKTAVNVENIVMSNPVLPGIALEPAVVGTVFALQPNKPSQAIEGNQGVYAVEVINFVNPEELVEPELTNQKKQQLNTLQQRSLNAIFNALQHEAKIDDNRIRFY